MPKHVELVELALASWREYAKGKPRSYNWNDCLSYQRAFISAYKKQLKIDNRLKGL